MRKIKIIALMLFLTFGYNINAQQMSVAPSGDGVPTTTRTAGGIQTTCYWSGAGYVSSLALYSGWIDISNIDASTMTNLSALYNTTTADSVRVIIQGTVPAMYALDNANIVNLDTFFVRGATTAPVGLANGYASRSTSITTYAATPYIRYLVENSTGTDASRALVINIYSTALDVMPPFISWSDHY